MNLRSRLFLPGLLLEEQLWASMVAETGNLVQWIPLRCLVRSLTLDRPAGTPCKVDVSWSVARLLHAIFFLYSSDNLI